jgi:hypothetical protein
MTAQDIIDLARYSELNNLAISKDTNAVIAFLNLGLIELYKRFPIKTKEYIVELEESTIEYVMPKDFMYAVSAYGEVLETSVDLVKPLSINEEDDPYSIFFIDWNTIQVPAVANGSYISIIYVGKPERIDADDLSVDIEIPDSLLEALVSYVGYRAHMNINGDAQGQHNAHWARFERSCAKAVELGVAFPVDSLKMSTRLSDRGFA